MARIIAIANQMSDVWKTVATLDFIKELAEAKKKMLLIDCDPRSNLSRVMGVNRNNVAQSTFDLVCGRKTISDLKNTTKLPWMDIVLLESDLNVVIELTQMIGRERVLKKVLTHCQNDYDYIFINCSSSLGLLTINAFTAVDMVIVMVQRNYTKLKVFSDLTGMLQLIKHDLNWGLAIEGILLTVYGGRTDQAV